MPSYVVGRVVPQMKGTYNQYTQYDLMDCVVYNNALYVCTSKPTVGTPPSITAHWTIMLPAAPKGDKGDKGDTGPRGNIGPIGPSMYQVWLDQGNTGTPQEMIEESVVNSTFHAVAFSGSWNDIINKPSLFSGEWNDVSGKPTIYPASWNTISDKPSFFTTNWDSVSDKPTVYPTNWANVSNKPTKEAFGLGNVDNTSDVNKPVSTAVQNEINTLSASLATKLNTSAAKQMAFKDEASLSEVTALANLNKGVTLDVLRANTEVRVFAIGATHTPNFLDRSNQSKIVTGNFTLNNPTNPIEGKTLTMFFRGDSATEYSIAFGSKYRLIDAGLADAMISNTRMLILQVTPMPTFALDDYYLVSGGVVEI